LLRKQQKNPLGGYFILLHPVVQTNAYRHEMPISNRRLSSSMIRPHRLVTSLIMLLSSLAVDDAGVLCDATMGIYNDNDNCCLR